MKKNKKFTFINLFDFLKNKSFIGRLKLHILIPTLLLVFCAIIYTIFGFNMGYDMQTQYVANIDFGATTTVSELNEYNKEIVEISNSQGFDVVLLNKTGETTLTGYELKIINAENYNDTDLTTKLANVKESLKSHFSSNYALNITDFSKQMPNYNAELTSLFVVLAIFIICLFIYTWIRYEITSAFTIVLGVFGSIITLTSILMISRICITSGFSAPYYIASVLSSIFYLFIISKIRKSEIMEDKKISTNSELVYSAVESSTNFVAIISISLICFALLIALISVIVSSQIIFLMLASIVAIIVAWYFGIYFNSMIWATIYNRKTDQKLKNKLDKMQKEELNKNVKKKVDEDKIVV